MYQERGEKRMKYSSQESSCAMMSFSRDRQGYRVYWNRVSLGAHNHRSMWMIETAFGALNNERAP